MTAETIDSVTFRELQRTAGEDFVAELVGTFLEEAPRMLAELEAALAAKDPDKFRRMAHSLKSNGNTFGALALGAMARDLELSGLDRALQAGPDPLAALNAEYERAARALKALCHA